MKNKNYFGLAYIRGELEGLAEGIETIEDFNREGAVKALRKLAKKVKNIQETESYEGSELLSAQKEELEWVLDNCSGGGGGNACR